MQSEIEAQAEAELLKDMYRNDLLLFAYHRLQYRDLTEATHKPITDALTSSTKRKLLCLPRGAFKSTLACVSYPIWLLLKNPNLRILIDSELYTNSKNFLREIKHHLMSQRLTSLFGVFESDVWNEGELTIKQRTRSYAQASITVGGIGTEKTGQHFDVVICDDMSGPSNSLTPEGRAKVIEHYRYLTSILEPQGTLVVVGTRYAVDDLIGWVLTHEVNEPSSATALGLLP